MSGLKLSAGREPLLAAVASVLAHAGREPTGLVAANERGVTVTGAADGSGARCAVEGEGATVGSPGDAALPLAPLAHVLRYAEGERVEVESTRAAVVVRIATDGPPQRFEFPAADPATVPLPDADTPGVALDLASEQLRRAVARVAFAADRRENKMGGWATTGILATLKAGRLVLAATDTYRLAVAPLAAEAPKKAAGRWLIPERSARAFAEAARRAESVTLTLQDSLATLEAGSLFAWSGLMHETGFPSWQMPDPPHQVALAPGRLLAAVESALAMADPDEPRLLLATEPGVLTVSAASAARGSGDVPLRVPGFRGPRVRLPVHGRRLGECLAAYATEERVVLRWESAERPIVLAAGECRCLVVPMVDRPRARKGEA